MPELLVDRNNHFTMTKWLYVFFANWETYIAYFNLSVVRCFMQSVTRSNKSQLPQKDPRDVLALAYRTVHDGGLTLWKSGSGRLTNHSKIDGGRRVAANFFYVQSSWHDTVTTVSTLVAWRYSSFRITRCKIEGYMALFGQAVFRQALFRQALFRQAIPLGIIHRELKNKTPISCQ